MDVLSSYIIIKNVWKMLFSIVYTMRMIGNRVRKLSVGSGAGWGKSTE